ncbi:RNA-binding RNA annealing protein [Tilletia horrida]|nr:RNA-binding RNA annealing protein [Tilletia horrida]
MSLAEMSSKLDQSLSDIIAAKPKTRAGSSRGRRPGSAGGAAGGRKRGSGGAGAKASVVGGAAASAKTAANKQRAPVVIPGRVPAGARDQGSKIIVSNLPLDVTETQVKELLSTQIGPLKRVSMSHRANGQSTGNCTVEFQRAEDGNRAYNQFNNRLIDGKRQMKIEVVVDPAKAAAQLVPAAAAPAKGAAAPARAANGGGRRGGRPAGRGAGAKRATRPKKSAEDLDAEMEDYAKNADKPAVA